MNWALAPFKTQKSRCSRATGEKTRPGLSANIGEEQEPPPA